MADLISDVAGPLLAQLAAEHDLVWRDHRIRATVPPQPGGAPTVARFVFPSRVPFVVLDLAHSSIRFYDGGIVDTTLRSRERTFVDEPIPLECLCNVVALGGEPGKIPPAIFFGNEELVWTLARLWPVIPFEIWPGAAIDSIVTLRFRGVELWPKGSIVKPADVR